MLEIFLRQRRRDGGRGGRGRNGCDIRHGASGPYRSEKYKLHFGNVSLREVSRAVSMPDTNDASSAIPVRNPVRIGVMRIGSNRDISVHPVSVYLDS